MRRHVWWGIGANLRVDLGWGTRPGSANTILPLWKVGQREGNLLRRARLASMDLGCSGGSGSGGIVVWIDNKIVESHSAVCVLVKGSSGGRRVERRRGRKGRGDRGPVGNEKPFRPFYTSGPLLGQAKRLPFIPQNPWREKSDSNACTRTSHIHRVDPVHQL